LEIFFIPAPNKEDRNTDKNNQLYSNKSNKVVLKAINVGKRFRDEEVLKNINFSVEAGEKIGIIGPSGCGKSTLLKCMNFIVEYDRGEIYLDNDLVGYEQVGERRIKTSETKIIKLRKKMGMVFQSSSLFPHLTVIDNLIEAPVLTKQLKKSEAIEKAERLLNTIGLIDKARAYPSTLSGGQRQRVAIVRALMMEPQMMLFDEITTGLDPSLVRGVLELLIKLAEDGMTMIIVSHGLNFLEKVADRILFLFNGVIWEEGSPDKLFNNPSTEELNNFLGGFYN